MLVNKIDNETAHSKLIVNSCCSSGHWDMHISEYKLTFN